MIQGIFKKVRKTFGFGNWYGKYEALFFLLGIATNWSVKQNIFHKKKKNMEDLNGMSLYIKEQEGNRLKNWPLRQ